MDQEPPFAVEDELFTSGAFTSVPSGEALRLPGHPDQLLQKDASVMPFLTRDLVATDLEKMSPKLWMMSKQDPSNISPLHRQEVKGRQLVLTEEPKLHLVWFYDRIFVKPLPKYLLCHSFWKQVLLQTQGLPPDQKRELVLRSALGLLRTYHYLIRHESDFRIAQSDRLHLIPQNVSWEKYCAFSRHFGNITDDEVSGRYHYGEIRLTRLNFYARFFLNRSRYAYLSTQYADTFASYYAPFLFAFALLSLALNAMQVSLAVGVQGFITNFTFGFFCQAFSIIALCLTLITTSTFAIGWLVMLVTEWNYALRDHWKRNRTIGRHNVKV